LILQYAGSQTLSLSHSSPGSMIPLPHPPDASVVVVVASPVVVVLSTVVVVLAGSLVVVVLVVAVRHPLTPHASQQLAYWPTQPPRCTHRVGPVTRHVVDPSGAVWQHVTFPARPQVERAAQRFTESAHGPGRRPSRTICRATSAAHRT